jgi:hypothetical protein
MSGLSRAVGGIAVGVVLLVGISWFDADQLWYAQRQADAGINSAGYSLLWALGALAMSGSVLLMGALAWWSRSLVLGVVYVIVGTIFVLTPVLVFNSVAMPEWLSQGFPGLLSISSPLDAGITIGAGMLISGVIALWAWARTRRGAAASEPASTPASA